MASNDSGTPRDDRAPDPPLSCALAPTYGEEFAAVLESRPLGPFDVADVLLGAIDARLRRRLPWSEPEHHPSPAMTQRIGGVAALVFGMFWAIGTGWASQDGSVGDLRPIAIMMIADVGLVIAVVGLSAVQGRHHQRLVWASTIGLLRFTDTLRNDLGLSAAAVSPVAA